MVRHSALFKELRFPLDYSFRLLAFILVGLPGFSNLHFNKKAKSNGIISSSNLARSESTSSPSNFQDSTHGFLLLSECHPLPTQLFPMPPIQFSHTPQTHILMNSLGRIHHLHPISHSFYTTFKEGGAAGPVRSLNTFI